jgi:hypothetical protein
MYTINDRVAADGVVRFEHLLPDLTTFLAEAGIPWDGWLPRSKGGLRPAGAPSGYREYYTPQLERLVGWLYAAEIGCFDYRF